MGRLTQGRAALLALLAAAAAVGGATHRALQDPGPPPEGEPIRVATWNVHRFLATTPDGRVTLEGVRSTLEAMDPDVVGLQESEMGRPTSGAYDAPGWLGRTLDRHVVYGPPTRDQIYGVALLSAYPVRGWEVVPLPVSDGIERVATEAVLETPDGPLPVLVAHLSVIERPGDRADQARALVDRMAGMERGVLVGDMNTPAGEGGEAYRVLDAALTDAWSAAGHPPGSGPTAFGPDPSVRIDHVWLAGNWTVEDARRWGGADVSDHRAVSADLRPQVGS